MNRREVLGVMTLTAAAPAAAATALAQVRKDDDTLAKDWTRRQRFAVLPCGEVAYVDRGTGPAALFLHGFPLSGFQWRHQVERFAGKRRCIVPDFLGLGFTRPAEGQSVAPSAQVQMLEQLLATLDVDKVDLVANDSGGAVAQMFAVADPRRVRTMLLTNCDVEPNSPPPALLPVLELAAQGKFADEWLAPWAADKMLARSAGGLGGMCYSRPGQPTDAAIDLYLGPLVESAARKALVNRYAVALEPNPLAGIEARLRTLPTPTRVVWGMKDDIFDPRMPDYLDALLPASRGVRRVAEGKLFWPEEYPEILSEELVRLWTP
ncbi:alpha/beta hydrolase [Phenylobacterium sp.]|uniref:alpha/beta fold hydrolase n=1 Tax=Phenylobacterium sp. TaxID=1871053 RepID=UPI002810C036|nr:alpha/beta hydrolase [Phenylobacterium sp.]